MAEGVESLWFGKLIEGAISGGPIVGLPKTSKLPDIVCQDLLGKARRLREREREVYIYIYIYTYTYFAVFWLAV